MTKEEKQAIIEAQSTHLGEKNTLEKAKTISLWLGMDNEIKKYVHSFPICQLQKTRRIKNQAKSILPDIPSAPNEKLALDIFGPLPETQKGNRYILSMQGRLIRYIVLVRKTQFGNALNILEQLHSTRNKTGTSKECTLH